MNIDAVIAKTAEINEANGWNFDINDRKEVALKVALFASEVAEVCEEYDGGSSITSPAAFGMPTSKWIENMRTEYADTIIRILHVLHKLRPLIPEKILYSTVYSVVKKQVEVSRPARRQARMIPTSEELHEATMRHLIRPTFDLFELLRNPAPMDQMADQVADRCLRLVATCELFAWDLDPAVSVWDIIDTKLEKNRGRGFKHGGKVY